MLKYYRSTSLKENRTFDLCRNRNKAEEELKDNFPEKLIKNSTATGYFGY